MRIEIEIKIKYFAYRHLKHFTKYNEKRQNEMWNNKIVI